MMLSDLKPTSALIARSFLPISKMTISSLASTIATPYAPSGFKTNLKIIVIFFYQPSLASRSLAPALFFPPLLSCPGRRSAGEE
jgi:hypothetical protein